MKTGFLWIGVILIALGIVGFARGGLSFSHQKTVASVGSVELNRTETSTYPISPILSGIVVVAGIGLIVAGMKNR